MSDRATSRPAVVMTVAGSDPSGSSGLQADLPTFAALGVHGTSVVTLLTAQDSTGVKAFDQVKPDLVLDQLRYLIGDLPPEATKTGLLRDVSLVESITSLAETASLGRLVVDPVLVDSAGTTIVDLDTIKAYRALASAATVFTPNRWEAELLTGESVTDEPSTALLEALRSLTNATTVITGGRGSGNEAVDIIITADHVDVITKPRIGSAAIRGTGCTFSAATAAYLGLGSSPLRAAEAAAAFVQGQLERTGSLRLGQGRPGVPHAIMFPPGIE